ncbi:MAG: hypothetical protein Q9P01_17345 [Anaerolineae bacterium]|nr:hypothetical protein [Anaerolineae bacterium]MDQ7036526.1 hypothetical protein [Anaerolineae bacterium]
MSEKDRQSEQDGHARGLHPSSILSFILIFGMLAGFAAIFTVFRQNPQSLPISLGNDSNAIEIQSVTSSAIDITVVPAINADSEYLFSYP